MPPIDYDRLVAAIRDVAIRDELVRALGVSEDAAEAMLRTPFPQSDLATILNPTQVGRPRGLGTSFRAATDNPESCVVVIEGLLRSFHVDYLSGRPQTYTVPLQLEKSDSLSSLWDQLDAWGYLAPSTIESEGRCFKRDDKKPTLSMFERIKVIANNRPNSRTQIRVNDTLIAHANEWHGEQFEMNVENDSFGNPKRPSQSLRDGRGLDITFQRTIRMPDDNRLHQLPGSLGTCDLYNVEAYSHRLPARIRDAGGVFLSMWQREAMWINFDTSLSRTYQKWAVRAYVGRINAVSGLKMDEDQKFGKNKIQDYVVIPGQRWLDGICVAPGIVRQFVAMPLGSGYTIEGQKTSEEKFGGLQLEIIPEYERNLRWWARDTEDHVLYDRNGFEWVSEEGGIDENKTPAKMKLKIGDTLRSYAQPVVRKETVKIGDLIGPDGKATWKAQYWVGASAAMPEVGLPGAAMLTRASAAPSFEAKENTSREPASRSNAATAPERLLNVEVTDVNAMGLAAGGKLVQDIYKDQYPANIWNHAAARIINVHILDPVSCEKVTHIVPIPPPSDVQSYANMGGKFYVLEEKVDERLDGGDFDDIKSVSQMDKHIGVSTEPEFDPLKPKMCTECGIRLCDCIIRPCDHQFCNVCIKKLENQGKQDPVLASKNWKCPTCNAGVSHVAGFSAPMNLPGEEPIRTKVPVHVLEINDGRVKFSSVQKTRI